MKLLNTVKSFATTSVATAQKAWANLTPADREYLAMVGENFIEVLMYKACEHVDQKYVIPAITRRSPKTGAFYATVAKYSYRSLYALSGATVAVGSVKHTVTLVKDARKVPALPAAPVAAE